MRLYRLLAGLLTGSYFFILTRGAFSAYFTPDDTMNLYRSWSFPLSSLIRANFLFWETSVFYRPFASAWYRSIYFFVGFQPRAFHVSNLLFLAANIFLTYAVARRLSDSREVGRLAALFGCYHTSFASLYFDTGFIYDVLCYFFYFLAFLFYLRIRQAGRTLSGWPIFGMIGLYICALNSKEMAVSLPLFLGLYELLYFPPRAWNVKELRRWILSEGRGPLILGGMTVVFAVGRATGAESLMHNAAYLPVLTWQRFLETSRNFESELFFLPGGISAAAVLLLWAAMLVVAWAAKSRTLLFAWLFLMLSAGPIAFSLPRGAPQYYVPLFGWVLYAAAAIAGANAWLVRRIPYWRPAMLFGGLLILLFVFYETKGWANVDSVRREAPVMRSIAVQLRELHPRIPPASRLFFLNDPIEPDRYYMIFVARLSYGDDSLIIDRLKEKPQRPGDDELATYNYVFDYKGGRFIEMSRPWLPKTLPTIVLNPAGAEVYHQGWLPVTAGRAAARPGEMLISKAIDLGSAAAQVEVRVNGRKTDLGDFLEWPNEPGNFRLDFRVPSGISPGRAKVEVTAGGLIGPPTYVPVAAGASPQP